MLRSTPQRAPARRGATVRPTPAPSPPPDPGGGHVAPGHLSETAARIRRLSVEHWGEDRSIELIGRDERFLLALTKIEKFARFNEPVLITGESGVGKELIARACYLLSWRVEHPFICVNCPQFHDSNTTVSELFGHRRGSFTGATADHQGLFEAADHGVLFLDEIGDLPLSTQVLLLRALAEGEFKPLGANETQRFHARFIAATNQDLSKRLNTREFREDLFFRLRYFRLEVPALRHRGDDWRLLLDTYLDRLNAQYHTRKHFSGEALKVLAAYSWPGNVRELRGIVSMGYSLSDGDEIGLGDFHSELEGSISPSPSAGISAPSTTPSGAEVPLQPLSSRSDPGGKAETVFRGLAAGQLDFWGDVHSRFMERELNRPQVRNIIAQGLRECQGSYRRLCRFFRVDLVDYHKFMDFLRHHRLKPGG